jgi:hypothetical protein
VTADTVRGMESKLLEGMSLDKCLRCMCMKGTLDYLRTSPIMKENPGFSKRVRDWLRQMKEIDYDCLGCEPCIPWQAMEQYKR